jgi:hypothetical protein
MKKTKEGKELAWVYGGKQYTGTEIPSMETADARFARTHNCKVKVLTKA